MGGGMFEELIVRVVGSRQIETRLDRQQRQGVDPVTSVILDEELSERRSGGLGGIGGGGGCAGN